MKQETAGFPESTYEDIVFALCEGNYAPSHIDAVKSLKVSTAEKIMVHKEKEAFKAWKQRKELED